MSTRETQSSESPRETRERLEHEADVVRERLGEHLSVLSERRHRFANTLARLREEARRHPVLLVVVGLSVAAGLGSLLYRRRARARRANATYQIARAVSVLMGDGQAAPVPTRPAGPSLAKKSLARVGNAVLSAAISEIGRRSAPRFTREKTYRPLP